MDNVGLASLRLKGEEDGASMDIDWSTLQSQDIQAMRDVIELIPGWETEYNRLFSNPSYSASDDGRMDDLINELLNAYSIRETLKKIDAVNALMA